MKFTHQVLWLIQNIGKASLWLVGIVVTGIGGFGVAICMLFIQHLEATWILWDSVWGGAHMYKATPGHIALAICGGGFGALFIVLFVLFTLKCLLQWSVLKDAHRQFGSHEEMGFLPKKFWAGSVGTYHWYLEQIDKVLADLAKRKIDASIALVKFEEQNIEEVPPDERDAFLRIMKERRRIFDQADSDYLKARFLARLLGFRVHNQARKYLESVHPLRRL